MRTGTNTPAHPRKKRGFFSLRFQVVSVLLLCYLIPTVVLGLFARYVLLGSMQQNVETALVSNSRYAWNMTLQNLNRFLQMFMMMQRVPESFRQI